MTLPLSLSLAMFRLSAEESVMFPSLELEYLLVAPHVCSLLSYLELTWNSLLEIVTLISILFRENLVYTLYLDTLSIKYIIYYIFLILILPCPDQVCLGEIFTPRSGGRRSLVQWRTETF